MRVVGLAVSAALVGALLAGCGGDGDDYCSVLRDENAELNRLADAAAQDDPGYLTDTLATFERVRAAAPADLRDEWDTVVFAWSDLVDTLEESGIDPGTFDPDERPTGVPAEVFRNVKDVAAELGSLRVLDAVRGINQHARDACDLSLDL